MKRIILIVASAFIASGNLGAQNLITYPELISGIAEVSLADSLNFGTTPADTTELDSTTVKRYFPQLLSTGSNRFKNKSYSLLGKITANNNFDLLILLEDKKRSDSSGIQVVYLVSMKKTGDYIASIKAAVNGTKKKTAYNISSCLYKGNKIIQDARIKTNDQLYDDMTYYKISSAGRFIIDSNN